MENFLLCLHAVLPLFLIMAAGYVARMMKILTREEAMRFISLVFHVFMPILLFHNLYNASIDGLSLPKFIIFAFTGVLVTYILATVFANKVEDVPAKRGVMIQALLRSNYNIMGIPVVTALLQVETSGLAAILLPVLVPGYNILSVLALQLNQEQEINKKKLIKNLLLHPFVIASVIGIFFMVTGIRLPEILHETIGDMASVATPAQLFLLGAFFEFGGLKRYVKELISISLGRLIVLPAIMLTAAWLFGFRGEEFVCLLGAFAAPCAVSSFPTAAEMGGDAELAGDAIIITSSLSCITLFLWAFFFKTIGVF